MHALTTSIKIRDRQGRIINEKEVATYAGLLSRAHEEGLTGIATELVQVPTAANKMVAIAKAQVTTSRGTFSGIGDASPDNVTDKIVPHIIRMAETRAKARALRDAVNIGIVCLEELGGDEGDSAFALDERSGGGPDREPRENVRDFRPRERQEERRRDERSDRSERGGGQGSRDDRSSVMTDNQRRYLFRMLANDGIEGDAATERIVTACNVRSIREVSKQQASRLIDGWSKSGTAGNGR